MKVKEYARDVKKWILKSALASNAVCINHKINFDKVKIVDHEKNYKKRMFSEMLKILFFNNSIWKRLIVPLDQVIHMHIEIKSLLEFMGLQFYFFLSLPIIWKFKFFKKRQRNEFIKYVCKWNGLKK